MYKERVASLHFWDSQRLVPKGCLHGLQAHKIAGAFLHSFGWPAQQVFATDENTKM